ncbi:MAG TPA: molybdopterin-dependent oxidoreductase, partial [Candidatus Aquicultoraceae bacterium]|nr:molybdopterin-dependent oxidoreductase [Candidatus Aquicultoraceae bacterium]
LDEFLGRTASTCFLEDLDDADVIVVVGADPGAAHPVLGTRIRRAARKGASVAVVHSCGIDLVRPSTLWLNPRRGTSGILLAEVLRRILAGMAADGRGNGAADREALRGLLAGAAPGGAQKACGVDPGKAEALARAVTGAGKVVAVYDLEGSSERSEGDLELLARILAATGHLVRPAGGLLLLGGDGGAEAAGAAGGGEDLSDAGSLEAIRGAVVLLEDPLSDPEGEELLRGLETLVVADHTWTRTATAAQVVLPASTLAETGGTAVRFDGTLHPVGMACRPPGGRTTGEVIRDLAGRIGSRVPRARPDGTGAAPLRAPRSLDLGKVRLSGKAGLPAGRSCDTMDEAAKGGRTGREERGAS